MEGNEAWIVKEISLPTDKEIDEAMEKSHVDMQCGKLSEFPPLASLSASILLTERGMLTDARTLT